MLVALIAAAGYGTRFFGHTQTTGKGFIQVSGSRLIDYVLSGLAEAGIEKAVIAANKDNRKIYSELKPHLDFDVVVSREQKGVAHLCYEFQNIMPEQYFLVFCHHPVTGQHLSQLEAITDEESMALSIFPDYTNNRAPVPVVLAADNSVIFNSQQQQVLGNAGAPFIVIGPEIAKLARDDNFQNGTASYIMRAAAKGMAVKGVLANIPPEIDRPWQLPPLEEFLKGHF